MRARRFANKSDPCIPPARIGLAFCFGAALFELSGTNSIRGAAY